MIKARIAAQVVRRLSVETHDDFHEPGYGRLFHSRGVDGRVTIIEFRDGHFNVMAGMPPDHVVMHAVEARVMLSLTRFVLWDWWVKSTWCGLKSRLWAWALAVLFTRDGKTRPRPRRDQSRSNASRQASRQNSDLLGADHPR